jgi:hypothetical protein
VGDRVSQESLRNLSSVALGSEWQETGRSGRHEVAIGDF